MGTEVRVQKIPPCDICASSKISKPATVDGRMQIGSWAYMCDEHWESLGVGQLGTGFGQRLILRDQGGGA